MTTNVTMTAYVMQGLEDAGTFVTKKFCNFSSYMGVPQLCQEWTWPNVTLADITSNAVVTNIYNVIVANPKTAGLLATVVVGGAIFYATSGSSLQQATSSAAVENLEDPVTVPTSSTSTALEDVAGAETASTTGAAISSTTGAAISSTTGAAISSTTGAATASTTGAAISSTSTAPEDVAGAAISSTSVENASEAPVTQGKPTTPTDPKGMLARIGLGCIFAFFAIGSFVHSIFSGAYNFFFGPSKAV